MYGLRVAFSSLPLSGLIDRNSTPSLSAKVPFA